MNKESPIKPAEKAGVKTPALMYEMIRSFVALADTLNLSHAVLQLESTRQTVRRHISLLEEMLGEPLFVVSDRKYEITDVGNAMLEGARDLLIRSNNWLSGSTTHIGKLQRVSKEVGSDWYFHQQQKPLSEIFDSPSPLLRDSFRGWSLAGGYLEHEAIAHVRPHFIVYRPTQSGWICVEFGEESFYVKWFGLAKARSSVGRPIGKMPGGKDFAALVEQPYDEVLHTRGVRLDHISTAVPREDGGPQILISYKRLMMAGRFPDGSFALIGIVQPERNVDISGFDNLEIADFPHEVNSVFSADLAKYERNE